MSDFDAHVLNMQLEEVYQEVAVVCKSTEAIESVSTALLNMETVATVAGTHSPLGVKLYRPKDTEKQWTMSISPLEKVSVTGTPSAISKPTVLIDLLVHMPRKMFLQKDQFDLRFLWKRAVYLEHVCAALSSAGIPSTVDSRDPLKPVLLLSTLNARILTTVDDFSTSKLCPTRSNLREHVSGDAPTPFYNNLVLEDTISKAEENPAVAKAVVLLKVWARQRGLLLDQDSHFTVTGALFSTVLNKLMSEEQVTVKSTLHQMLRQVFVYCSEFARSDFTQEGVFDPFFRLPEYVLDELRTEARIGLQLLESESIEGVVKDLLLKNYGGRHHYDYFVTLDLESLSKDTSLVSHRASASSRVYSLLKTALGDRVSRLSVIRRQDSIICVGFNLVKNWALATRRIETSVDFSDGSAAHKKEARKFREFWGARCETRKFSDGSICDVLEWKTTGMALLSELCIHIVDRHLQAAAKVQYIDETIESKSLDKLETAFAKLSARLKEAEGAIHLRIRAVTPTDPVMRGTHPYRGRPVEVVLDVERHGKWPDHLVAIERIKSAILVTLSVRFPNSIVALGFLDVPMDGILFRVRIWNPREVEIRRAERDIPGFGQTQGPEENAQHIAELERLEASMKLGVVTDEVAGRHAVFRASCRKAWDWLDRALGLAEFADVETGMAGVFDAPRGYGVAPGSVAQAVWRWLDTLGTDQDKVSRGVAAYAAAARSHIQQGNWKVFTVARKWDIKVALKPVKRKAPGFEPKRLFVEELRSFAGDAVLAVFWSEGADEVDLVLQNKREVPGPYMTPEGRTNAPEIMHDIALLGKGLVHKIKARKLGH